MLTGSVSVILAENFNILDGRVEVTVPWVMDRTDYSLVREYLSLVLG